jgi:THO complex subunit 5
VSEKFGYHTRPTPFCSSSIYQDVPLYSLDQFRELAPAEAVVNDEHQLMLNRLSFELAERQR